MKDVEQTTQEQMPDITLDRYTQFKANFPAIKAPRWHDSTFLIQASVGQHNKIECTYTRPDGTRMFPGPLYISGQQAKTYKPFSMQTAAGGTVRVRAIPISAFKRLKLSEVTNVW